MAELRRTLVLAGALLVSSTGTAAAESAAEVRDLARRAQSDPAALEQLRRIDDVDGRPADFRRVLNVEGDDLQRRLRTIESDVAAEPGVPVLRDSAQQEAARILEGERYQRDEPPRPLRGVIRKLGEWFEPVLEPLGRLFKPLGALFDSALGIGLLGGAIVAVAVLASSRLIARRNRAAAETRSASRAFVRVLDPAALDKEAEAAEAAGDYERAFRLRFLAGVLRLDKAGAIKYRESATTGELVREVRSPTFPQLARAFDEIAYGGRPTGPVDVNEAKAAWPRVLEEARR